MKHRKRKFRKIKKLVLTLSLLTCLMLFSGSLMTHAGDDSDVKGFANVQTRLNVRKEATTSSDIIAKMSAGETATVISTEKEGWTKIITNSGKTGYVKNEYFEILEEVNFKRMYDFDKHELVSEAIITAKESSDNRNFNMARACESINGLVLEPGDEFNWYGKDWKGGVVGAANKANGYKEATVINGGKYVSGFGGGVCQVSTAVYNCILKLNIEPTEIQHHSKDVSYVAENMDATVSYGTKNFAFVNTMDYTILLQAYTEGPQVIIRAYKVK